MRSYLFVSSPFCCAAGSLFPCSVCVPPPLSVPGILMPFVESATAVGSDSNNAAGSRSEPDSFSSIRFVHAYTDRPTYPLFWEGREDGYLGIFFLGARSVKEDGLTQSYSSLLFFLSHSSSTYVETAWHLPSSLSPSYRNIILACRPSDRLFLPGAHAIVRPRPSAVI